MTADVQIKSFFDRWERLEDEKKQIADLLKDLFAEAKGFGYDTKALRAAFRLKVKEDLDNPADAEFEAVVETYLSAINAPSSFTRDARMRARENIEEIPAADTGKRFKATVYGDGSSEVETTEYDRETGEILDAKLVETIAKGVQTEIGQAALLAAVDIMIAREDAGEETHQRPSTNDEPSPEVGPQAEASPAGTGAGTLADREGRHEGEVASVDLPTDLETIAAKLIVHKHTEIASATQGEAEAPSAERETELDEPAEGDCADANTGGDHVDARSLSAATAGALVNRTPATRLLRPHCQHRELCRSGTRDHCHSCKVAMREREEA